MTKDLTVGSPMRLILGFALPTLFGMLFQQMYNMVDVERSGRNVEFCIISVIFVTVSCACYYEKNIVGTHSFFHMVYKSSDFRIKTYIGVL